MREQRQESEWILSCQRSLRLKRRCTKDLCCHLLALVVDVVTKFSRGCASELLYADDLVLINETIDGLRNKFLTWKEAFESKGLKIKICKSKVMVNGGITGWLV